MPGQRAATLVESRLRQSAALHRETRTESSLDGSGSEEAAGRIEALCVRVADDVQDARGALTRDIGAMFDQQPPDALMRQGEGWWARTSPVGTHSSTGFIKSMAINAPSPSTTRTGFHDRAQRRSRRAARRPSTAGMAAGTDRSVRASARRLPPR